MTESTTGSQARSFRLIYRSRNQVPAGQRKMVLGDLFSEARSNNKAKGITGALLVNDDWFVQTLEGDEGDVRSLYARIENDPRHDTFSVLQEQPVVDRVFGRWSMAEVSAETGGTDTFLLAHKDGISPAASLQPTIEQESILKLMRAAARGAKLPDLPEREEVVDEVRVQVSARLGPRSM